MSVDPRYRILQPIRPSKGNWYEWEVDANLRHHCYAVERYYNRVHEIQVLSAIEQVRQDDSGLNRYEYHISVTGCRMPGFKVYRCSDQTAKFAMELFGFTDFVEDNHVPGGKTRNYWRPVVESQNPACECFATESTIVEDKGDYIWRHAPGK